MCNIIIYKPDQNSEVPSFILCFDVKQPDPLSLLQTNSVIEVYSNSINEEKRISVKK